MSFRLITTPLDKRGMLNQPPVKNEVIVDNVHGNLGIATTSGLDENLVYNSGTERNKSELDSLKIRNKNSNDNLVNISFGSENSVSLPDFKINNAIEDKNILGSLEYLLQQYKKDYIKSEDDEGNIELNLDTFSFNQTIKELKVKLYDQDTDSYDKKVKVILAKKYEELQNGKIEKADEIKKEEFNYLTLQKNVLDHLESLERAEMEVSILEKVIDTILIDTDHKVGDDEFSSFNSSRLSQVLDNLESELDELVYLTKCKKFESIDISDNEYINNYYRTNDVVNDEDKYFINKPSSDKTNIEYKDFEEIAPVSILDENFEGNINQYKIDGNLNTDGRTDESLKFLKPTGNFILNGQEYYDIPEKAAVVYDPIIKRPIFKIKSLKDSDNKFDYSAYSPSLESYINDDNLLLQYMLAKNYLDPNNTNPIFTIKNVQDNNLKTLLFRNTSFLKEANLLSVVVDGKRDDTKIVYDYNNIKAPSFFFPSIYNLGHITLAKATQSYDPKPLIQKIIDRFEEFLKKDHDFNYFMAPLLFFSTYEEQQSLGYLPSAYILRDSFKIYNDGYKTTVKIDDKEIDILLEDFGFDPNKGEYNYNYTSKLINYRYNENSDTTNHNNKNVMLNNYYVGINSGSKNENNINTYKNQCAKFQKHIDYINETINKIKLNNVLYPNFYGSSIALQIDETPIPDQLEDNAHLNYIGHYFKFDYTNQNNNEVPAVYYLSYDGLLNELTQENKTTEGEENQGEEPTVIYKNNTISNERIKNNNIIKNNIVSNQDTRINIDNNGSIAFDIDDEFTIEDAINNILPKNSIEAEKIYKNYNTMENSISWNEITITNNIFN